MASVDGHPDLRTDPPADPVLIVEDHQVVAQGLRALIERAPDLEVVVVVGTVA